MFAALVGMLAPQGKYKKFVSLVMGFILLGIMVAPLARFSTPIPVTDWFAGLGMTMMQTVDAQSIETSYANWRNTYLRSAFSDQLTTQLTNYLTQNGFVVYAAHVSFSDDFSTITSVEISVTQREQAAQRVPFIRIQPVQVGQQEQTETCPIAETVKNLVSQFYNVPKAHIHVLVIEVNNR